MLINMKSKGDSAQNRVCYNFLKIIIILFGGKVMSLVDIKIGEKVLVKVCSL